MKQSMTKTLDFFKRNKYARIGVVVLFAGLVVSGILFARLGAQDKPISLSQVAAAISAGKVAKIEDSQEKGIVTIYYKDGSQKTARRDLNSSFLEQIKFLGVNDSQLAKLQ